MDKIVAVTAFAVISGYIAFSVKKASPQVAVIISVCASASIMLFVADDIFNALSNMESLAEKLSIDDAVYKTVFKITAVSFAGQFGASFCRDMGENSLAEKTELAVKVIIILITVPYIEKLFSLVQEI